jgi:hypothetical protein
MPGGVRAWSKALLHHRPVYILVETKQEAVNLNFPTTQPEIFTPAIFDDLDGSVVMRFR